MLLPLTVESLRAAYEYLCTTPPFNKWNLPDGEDVKFRVSKTPVDSAWLYKVDRKPLFEIVVSQRRTGRTETLMENLSHEMIHIHLFLTGMDSGGEDTHNAAFKKLAEQVCKYHGFDLKLFY